MNARTNQLQLVTYLIMFYIDRQINFRQRNVDSLRKWSVRHFTQFWFTESSEKLVCFNFKALIFTKFKFKYSSNIEYSLGSLGHEEISCNYIDLSYVRSFFKFFYEAYCPIPDTGKQSWIGGRFGWQTGHFCWGRRSNCQGRLFLNRYTRFADLSFHFPKRGTHLRDRYNYTITIPSYIYSFNYSNTISFSLIILLIPNDAFDHWPNVIVLRVK